MVRRCPVTPVRIIIGLSWDFLAVVEVLLCYKQCSQVSNVHLLWLIAMTRTGIMQLTGLRETAHCGCANQRTASDRTLTNSGWTRVCCRPQTLHIQTNALITLFKLL